MMTRASYVGPAMPDDRAFFEICYNTAGLLDRPKPAPVYLQNAVQYHTADSERKDPLVVKALYFDGEPAWVWEGDWLTSNARCDRVCFDKRLLKGADASMYWVSFDHAPYNQIIVMCLSDGRMQRYEVNMDKTLVRTHKSTRYMVEYGFSVIFWATRDHMGNKDSMKK